MTKMLLACVSFAVCASYAKAATINAASAALADIETAHTSASNGDIIIVPAGDVIWTGTLTVSKNIELRGAGTNATIIRATTAVAQIITLGTTTSWLRGFQLISSNSSGSAQIIQVRGQNVRISDMWCRGINTKVLGLYVNGGTGIRHPTGVCWNSRFTDARQDVQGDIANSANQQFGRRIWANSDNTVGLGTSNTWFVEDCLFEKTLAIGQNMFDHEYGGHSVIRYNHIRDATVFAHGVQSNTERGTRQVEVYSNSFEQVNLSIADPPIWLRSGTAAVYSNVVTGTWSNRRILLSVEEWVGFPYTHFGDSPYDDNRAVANGTGTHDGSGNAADLSDSGKSWTVNGFVGIAVYNLTDGSLSTNVTANTATTVTTVLQGGTDNDWDAGDSYKITDGWPRMDQPGTSTDAALWTGSPAIAKPLQALAPVYCWTNSILGTNLMVTSDSGWVQQNRDYYNHTVAPDYAPYTYPHPLRSEESVTPATPAVTIGSGVTLGGGVTVR